MKTKALITVTIVFAALGALHAADQLNPAITFDGSNFLVVWQEMGPDSMNGVYGKRVDIAGNAIDQQTFRISPADNNAGAPGITYGTEYFVTWVDQKADSIRCARVSSSGTVLDNTITIPEIQTYGTKKASIAFDGTNYLLPYVFHYPFYCALLSQSGSILSSQRLMSSDCSEGAQVIFGSENYLVVWKDFGWKRRIDQGLAAQMISRNNEVVGLRKYLLPTSDILDVKGHYVASDGTNWLVVYYNEKDVTVVGKRIDGSGAILDSTGIEIAFSQTLFDLTFDDRNYLVLTGDINGLCITKVDPRGNVGEATDIPFPPNSVETPVMAYGKKGISLIAYSYCRDSTHQKEIRTMIFNSYTTTIKKAVVSQKLRVNSMRNIKTVEMYDVLGRKVKTVPVSAFANWKEGSGVYIAKFTGTAGRQYKIISFN